MAPDETQGTEEDPKEGGQFIRMAQAGLVESQPNNRKPRPEVSGRGFSLGSVSQFSALSKIMGSSTLFEETWPQRQTQDIVSQKCSKNQNILQFSIRINT